MGRFLHYGTFHSSEAFEDEPPVCPAESQSETELVVAESVEVTGPASTSDSGADSAPTPDQRSASSEEPRAGPISQEAQSSPAHKPSLGQSLLIINQSLNSGSVIFFLNRAYFLYLYLRHFISEI